MHTQYAIIQLNTQIITRPNPHQPINPYYGTIITQKQNPLNPYHAPLQHQCEQTFTASAPSFEEISDSKANNEHMEPIDTKTLNSAHLGFKIAQSVCLKSVLFGSWASFNEANHYLHTISTAPMVTERFMFERIDNLNNTYTIQTSNGLYLSADNDGNYKFVSKVYGVYEQWKIEYHHINKISITSKYYSSHLGVDSNGRFHHRYPSITDICLYEVSPPIILTQKQQKKAIDMHHWQSNQTLAPAANTEIAYPKLLNNISIALCVGNSDCIGIESTTKKRDVIKCDYTTYQSFDGELLKRSQFNVFQDKPYQLYAFKSALNGKYLSPSDTINGQIKFLDVLTQREYFQIIWNDVAVVTLVTYHGTVVRVKNGTLSHEGYDWKSKECVFEIKSKVFSAMNSIYKNIPCPQLPVRSINGALKRDIWLKPHFDNLGYLAFRSQPYRLEAVSKIMGRWETLRFEHDMKRNYKHLNKCIVSLYTENGMIIGCDDAAQIVFLSKDDEKDELKCRWMILFHHYSLISIQNEKFKGWMTLKRHIKNNTHVLSLANPNFDHNGRPIIDVEHARMFKNVHCQFELCPIANCKDLHYDEQSGVNLGNGHKQNSISFAM